MRHLIVVSCVVVMGSCASGGSFDELAGHVRHNRVEHLRSALASGFRVDETDDRGETLLHRACLYPQSTEAARVLIARGASVHARNRLGYTPLHLCALNDCLETARELIASGAKKDARDNQGFTPYERAKWVKARRVLELLAP